MSRSRIFIKKVDPMNELRDHIKSLLKEKTESNGKLMDKEKEILNKLTDAHNLFMELDVQHPEDEKEWTKALHDLQRLVMIRETRRNNPDMFDVSDGSEGG